ncbi:hypothetical protein BDV95DRAFT_133448 [Massariosphaeria phaeospora]|uniref:SET domain-containing protein n=1 Tax=Massariosphaeria phaeospora TaxID=100035 RepID=A0A7C8IGY4_9PLEO|nr:hypothetical protein BDV95DRAFT_133448 [Massariosphaeria phaeospora]
MARGDGASVETSILIDDDPIPPRPPPPNSENSSTPSLPKPPPRKSLPKPTDHVITLLSDDESDASPPVVSTNQSSSGKQLPTRSGSRNHTPMKSAPTTSTLSKPTPTKTVPTESTLSSSTLINSIPAASMLSRLTPTIAAPTKAMGHTTTLTPSVRLDDPVRASEQDALIRKEPDPSANSPVRQSTSTRTAPDLPREPTAKVQHTNVNCDPAIASEADAPAVEVSEPQLSSHKMEAPKNTDQIVPNFQASTTIKPRARGVYALKTAPSGPSAAPKPLRHKLGSSSSATKRVSHELNLKSKALPGSTQAGVEGEKTQQKLSPSVLSRPGVEVSPTKKNGLVIPPVEKDLSEPAAIGRLQKTVLLEDTDMNDFQAMSTLVEGCLRKHLDDFHKLHARTVKNRLRRQRTCYNREVRQKMGLGPLTPDYLPSVPDELVQATSPFAVMNAIQVSTTTVRRGEQTIDITETMPANKYANSYLSAPITRYKSKTVNVPYHHEYISVQDSVLVENDRKILAWPYFEDEDDALRPDFSEDLRSNYDIRNLEHPERIVLAEQCRVYYPCTNDFFEELGITFDHVIYWLLAPDEVIIRINDRDSNGDKFERLLLKREQHCDKALDRTSEKWKAIFAQLSTPSATALRCSALACSTFSKQGAFRLWHLIRQTQRFMDLVSVDVQTSIQSESGFSYRDVLCRVCHEHYCPFHGENREYPDPELIDASGEQQAASAAIEESDDSDSDIDVVINYRRAANASALAGYSGLEGELGKCLSPPDEGPFDVDWWKEKTNTHWWERRGPFYPCSHEGSCKQAQCRCFREGINCEKSCKCSATCKRRFPGCSSSCVKIDARGRVCGGTQDKTSCICRKLARECDADLCGSCGALDVLDPVNRYDEEIGKGRCCNVPIQRDVPRRTLLGHSEVHGFGLYMGEDVKKDEFLAEYKGEIITISNEGDRRSAIYAHQRTCYQFKLNREQDVDSTNAGNKFRFVNAAQGANANCYPKIVLCNTTLRIALYAKRDIPTNVELFFDYGYDEHFTKNFRQPQAGAKGVGRVFALKSKNKTSLTSTSTSTSTSMSSQRTKLPTPDRRLQTAKARAAKAAKQNASKEQSGGTEPSRANRPRANRPRARKSIINTHEELSASRRRGRVNPPSTSNTGSTENPQAESQRTEHQDADENDPYVAESSDEDDEYDIPMNEDDDEPAHESS